MRPKGGLLAGLAAASLCAVPAWAGGGRFGAAAGASAIGGWGWAGGWFANAWVRGHKVLTLEVDYGRYRDAADPDWRETFSVASAGLGVRGRGSVQPFAHVLLGVYRERIDATYDHGMGQIEHERTTSSEAVMVFGAGVDLGAAGPFALHLGIDWLRTSDEGEGLRPHLGVGLRF